MKKDNKQAVPKKHWEVQYHIIPKEKTPMNAWVPKVANQRPTPHVKVNKEDH